MWNQQGNGNQYGNQYNSGDPYDRCDNAKPISNRDPYIEEGQHLLAVISIEEVPHQDFGIMDRARFLVLESQTMKPGTVCSSVWFIQKPPPKPGMVTDSDRFADFCCRLKGAPAGYPIGRDIRVLVRERAAEQLARGQVIRAYGVRKFAKNVTEKNKDGFVVVNWTHVEQTPQQIAEMRAQIEAKGLVQENRGTGGGQYQGAPHPSQMQGQYPAQQGYSANAGGQWGGQPATNPGPNMPAGAQPGYGPTPEQQIQGQPNPAYYPNAQPQQGWGQPQTQPGPQQGGYLANVPTNPQGGQGNGGQGQW